MPQVPSFQDFMQRYLQHGPLRGYNYEAKTGASLDETKIECKVGPIKPYTNDRPCKPAWVLRDHSTCKSGTGSWYAFAAPDHPNVFQRSAWFGRNPITEQMILSKIEHLWGNAGARASARRPEISTWPSHRNNSVGEAVGRTKAAGEEKLGCYPRLGSQGFTNLLARGYL